MTMTMHLYKNDGDKILKIREKSLLLIKKSMNMLLQEPIILKVA